VECWKIIESKFNNQSGDTYRHHQNLRKKYENLKKKKMKKKVADKKCYSSGTGGGPAKTCNPVVSDLENEIKELLGERKEGLPT